MIPGSSKDRLPLRVARACGLVVAGNAALALTGWGSGMQTLASWGEHYVPMAPSTAVLFVILGIALMTAPYRRRALQLAARGGALLVIVVTLARLAEFAFGIRLDIDRLFFQTPEGYLREFPIGQMASVTAVTFLFSGCSLLCMTLPRGNGTVYDVAGMLAIVAGAMGMGFGLGYVIGTPFLYSGGTIPMAPSTAAGFFFFGPGVLAALMLTDVREPGAKGGRLGLSIGRKVLGGFGLALAAVLFVSILAYNNTLRLLSSSRLVAHTHEVLAELEGTISTLKAVESASRGFVITGDEGMRSRSESASRETEDHLQRLRGLSADDERQQLRVAAVEPLIRDQVRFNLRIVQARRDGGVPAATDSLIRGSGSAGMQAIRSIADAMEREERTLLRDRSRESEADVRNAIGTYALLVLLVFGILTGIYIIVHRDLTGRREAEEESRRLAERLEASNKDLEGFSYSISHDLRAPLRHIDGFGQRLLRHAGGMLDPEGRRFLNVILESVRHMGVLIDDLLVFSRVGRVELTWSRVAMDELVRDVIRTLEDQCAGRRIDWHIGPLPEVQGDTSMLRLVLLNLIENAVKYTRPRPEAHIEIGFTAQEDEKEFFVRDNGVGFDMQYAGKLFGVFQRLHSAAEFEGTGIGLANVRRIIQRHGGLTWAEGTTGQGAAFFFTLPETPGEREPTNV